ncbi:ROK family protein [Halomonas daqingensis]|uniref:ROK family protein n=1 Tax=Billgrantia desiderata TaxID=52021 RepID=UPI000A3A27F6|nr:ROK family protein [Halomonas desiderata]MCE8011828.1 ROK family protein [Halomonas desiderata]MCE8028611.1 ROK family protein [Halomonas desiderata]NIC37425.1 ROK family protein [Halomonas desiderata]OUE39403.1 transcriptional regulator [Halomonas desiderata SP1]
MSTSNQQHKAGDLHFLKRLNRSAILELVRRTPGLTRADIATQAQLTKATVGAGVQSLLNQGWLREGELQKSSGGRPGRALHLNEEQHVLLGAEVGVHGLRLVACTLAGQVLVSHHEHLVPTTPEVTAELLGELLHALMQEAPVKKRRCLGLGIALPGPIAPNKPVLRLAPNLGWRDVRFLELLRPHLPHLEGTWLMDNEAKSAAFGELYFRTGNIPESLVYVSAGTGIGSGMVEGSHLPLVTRGIQGLAGEIGHTVLQPGGLYCHCGNRGCAETLVSGWSIRAALGIAEEEDLIESLLPRLDEPDVQVTLRRAGEALGVLLLNLHHTQNPSEIVLGGSLTQLGAPLLGPALDFFKANQNRLLGTTQQVPLRVVQDSTFIAARGAAAQVLASIIHGSSDLGDTFF